MAHDGLPEILQAIKSKHLIHFQKFISGLDFFFLTSLF